MAAGRIPADPLDASPMQLREGQSAVTVRLVPFGTIVFSAVYPAISSEQPDKQEVQVIRGGTGGIRTITVPKPTIQR